MSMSKKLVEMSKYEQISSKMIKKRKLVKTSKSY